MSNIRSLQFKGWNNPDLPERLEYVFGDRNKDFGAYLLRKEYKQRITKALLVITACTLVLFILNFLSHLNSKPILKKTDRKNDVVHLTEPPSIDQIIPPPPAFQVVTPPPLIKTIKFTPPLVVKDEEVQEAPPPTQEEVKHVQVGTITQDGVEDVEVPPDNPVTSPPDEDKRFTIVEEMPTFPGGNDKLHDYIRKNLIYPQMARENGIAGKVYISFLVDKVGKISEIALKKGIGGGCDEEALRVVKRMPDWKPGRENGMNVKVNMMIHIDFRLQ